MADPSTSDWRSRRHGGPARDAETVRRLSRQARRRRGFAVTMMALMGLSSLGLAVTFFYTAGNMDSAGERRQEPRSQVAVSNKSVKMTAPMVTGFDRKKQAYQINAKEARQDQNEPHIVHMDGIIANLKLRKSGDNVQVTSDTGIYDSEAETLKLSGNVLMTTASGFTAQLERADVALKEGRIETDRPLTVTSPDGAIAANAMELWDNGANVRFFNRARMLLKGDRVDAKKDGKDQG